MIEYTYITVPAWLVWVWRMSEVRCAQRQHRLEQWQKQVEDYREGL